eukprot:1888274-Amphidinium_carterae.1
MDAPPAPSPPPRRCAEMRCAVEDHHLSTLSSSSSSTIGSSLLGIVLNFPKYREHVRRCAAATECTG